MAGAFYDPGQANALRPPKGRTWARRGQTPVVRVTGDSNKRVSLAALIRIKPGQPRQMQSQPAHRAGKARLKRMQYRPGLLSGFLASTRLDLTPFCNPHN